MNARYRSPFLILFFFLVVILFVIQIAHHKKTTVKTKPTYNIEESQSQRIDSPPVYEDNCVKNCK